MNTVARWTIALALLAGPMVAESQTYNLDITMTGVSTFDGSFTFNSAGTCFGSAPYCAGGTIPDFTGIHVSDPFNGGAFTGVQGTAGALDLVNFEGLPPSTTSSEIFQLSFNYAPALGGAATNFALSNIVFNVDNNVTGLFYCGTSPTGYGSESCPTETLTKAPEIDPASIAGPLVLLVGGLAILRSTRHNIRRRESTPRLTV
jgi:hypothetical protein